MADRRCRCAQAGLLQKAREGGAIVRAPRWVRITPEYWEAACGACGRVHRYATPGVPTARVLVLRTGEGASGGD